jgi:tetratricopeptide (TPR) repeat protein
MAMTLGGIHWSLAETLLGFVEPAGASKPAPERDEMVRAWYQATTMWMQRHEQRDLQHLHSGLDLFPGDATLLFLSGCEHEAYASPAIQVPLAGTGNTGPVHSVRDELERAATEFRKSLDARAGDAETLLHLGHVQLLLGDHDEAIETLKRPYEAFASNSLRYVRDMFLGQAHEQAAALADARAAYERAHALCPQAQSPLLALSQLHRRADNYQPAKQAVDQLWAVVPETDDDDPWWAYSTSHTAQADTLVEAVWHSVD